MTASTCEQCCLGFWATLELASTQLSVSSLTLTSVVQFFSLPEIVFELVTSFYLIVATVYASLAASLHLHCGFSQCTSLFLLCPGNWLLRCILLGKAFVVTATHVCYCAMYVIALKLDPPSLVHLSLHFRGGFIFTKKEGTFDLPPQKMTNLSRLEVAKHTHSHVHMLHSFCMTW